MRMPVYNLEWQEPPAADDAVIQMILGQLQNNPGQWARICKDRSQTALVTKWQKMGCEAKHHRTNMGQTPARYDIYARWPKDKAATIPNTIRAEIAESTASTRPPSAIRQAVDGGRAHTPPPARPTGGYIAQRAARGVPEGGNPV